MKQRGRFFVIMIYLLGLLNFTSGCVYGPAISGSELPVVPIPEMDTVRRAKTYLMDTAEWPQVYEYTDENFLLGLGMQRTISLPYYREYGKTAWSFVYGGMFYRGTYQLNNSGLQSYGPGPKPYHGVVVHGAGRLHIMPYSAPRLSLILELGLSLYYENGDYYYFREQYNQQDSINTWPVAAAIFPQVSLRYKINENTFIRGTYMLGTALDPTNIKFTSAGVLAITYHRLTGWAQAGVHLNYCYAVATADWTVGTGLNYRIGK